MKYKKILFATDFSPASQLAFDYATSLARDTGATLLVAHVQEYPVSYPGGDMFVVHPDAPNPVLRAMLAKVVPSGGVPHEHHLLLGLPADEIVRLAEEQHVDLIVIGSHGRTGLSRMLMGSVAELVMRRAKCPVLTVKGGGILADADVAAAKSTTSV